MFSPILWYFMFGLFTYISVISLDLTLWEVTKANPVVSLFGLFVVLIIWPFAIVLRVHNEYVVHIEERYRERIMKSKNEFHNEYNREYESWKK